MKLLLGSWNKTGYLNNLQVKTVLFLFPYKLLVLDANKYLLMVLKFSKTTTMHFMSKWKALLQSYLVSLCSKSITWQFCSINRLPVQKIALELMIINFSMALLKKEYLRVNGTWLMIKRSRLKGNLSHKKKDKKL